MCKFIAYQEVKLVERREIEIDERLVKKMNIILGWEDIITLNDTIQIAMGEIEQVKHLDGIIVPDGYGNEVELINWIDAYLKQAASGSSVTDIINIRRDVRDRFYRVEE